MILPLKIYGRVAAGSTTTLVLEQCMDIGAGLPSQTRFQLAQEFNNFYHKHHILTEERPATNLLAATAAVALRELVLALSWLE